MSEETEINENPDYAVLVSDENGSRPNFEAVGVCRHDAMRIASGHAAPAEFGDIRLRTEVQPIGRAESSFLDESGWVWSVVRSKK
jgi:hypothetical protein